MAGERIPITVLLDPDIRDAADAMAARIHRGAEGSRALFLRNIVTEGTRLCEAIWMENELLIEASLRKFRRIAAPIKEKTPV